MRQDRLSEETKRNFERTESSARLPFWKVALRLLLAAGLLIPQWAAANGGPFVIKYPGGDPAAKGVLARLDPDLKPAREERLKVLKEELSIAFSAEPFPADRGQGYPPSLARVTARYFIANPTDETIDVDFGFPILRGIYVSPFSMLPKPDVRVSVKVADRETNAQVSIISNSEIYGLIRSRARDAIEAAVARDAALQACVKAVRESVAEARDAARQALAQYARRQLRWHERDATLLIEYVSLDLGKPPQRPAFDATWHWGHNADDALRQLVTANLGPLSAMGEQKATQLLAHLAGRFDAKAAADYERIFAAWGGDVRERSVDLQTGKTRPREYQADNTAPHRFGAAAADPTIYARLDYLDENAKISDEEKASCKAILKNLPVTFTFAPMNLLHYRVRFAPCAEQIVTVSYSQYAYLDTRTPPSYQLAYVVHPASLWKEFGPIELSVFVPEGMKAGGSVPLKNAGTANPPNDLQFFPPPATAATPYSEYRGTIADKTGELFVAIDAAAWREHVARLTALRAKPAQAASEPNRPHIDF